MIHARTLTLAAGVTVLAAQLWAAPAALAAPRDGAPAQGSGVMGLDEWRAQVTDTAGVPIEKYRALPLDHGTAIELDIEHSMKRSALVSILDLLWGIHYEIVTTVMWLLHTLLSFEWVGWFAAPMESFGAAVGQMVAQIHWIPLASMISGLAIALLFAARRRGAAWGELALSVTMVIVATNMALNPVAYVTGDNGVLTKAEEAAGQISVEIAGGADQLDSGASASEVMGQTLTADLTDMLMRGPSQAVAFGESLTGECDAVFTQTMSESDPMKVEEKTVMDPVKDCSESAASWSESISFTRIAPMVMINLGSLAFSAMAFVLGLVLIVAVLMALFYALYQGLAVLVAILPLRSRLGFFNAFIGVLACAVGIVAAIVTVSLCLQLLKELLAVTAGLGVTVQMLLMVIVLVVLCFLIFRSYVASRAKGRALARWLSGLGLSKQGGSNKVKALAGAGGAAAAGYKARKWIEQRRGKAETEETGRPRAGLRTAGGGPDAAAQPGAGPRRLGPGPTRPGLPTAPVLRAVGTGAAGVGGPWGAAAGAAAHLAASRLERGAHRRELAAPRPRKVERFSRIQIDKNGQAVVNPPRREVVEGTVVPPHQGPRPRQRSSEATRRMRERLQQGQP